MIFLHHFAANGKALFPAGGSCGVSFFMILSGVVMSLGYYNKCMQPHFSYKTFLAKRLIRLYPLHLACLSAFILLHPQILTNGDCFKLIPNLLLIQSWIPIKSIYFYGNAVSWCLSDMMFFYALFPFIVKLTQQNNKTRLLLFILISVIYIILTLTIPDNYSHQLLYISPLFRIYDFIIGIIIYIIYREYNESIRKVINQSININAIGFICIAMLSFTIYLFSYINIRFMYAFAYIVPVSMLILYFLIFEKDSILTKILNNRLLYKMGEVSFSFYMIHTISFTIMDKIITKLDLNIEWQYKLIIYLLLVSIASLLIYNLYEKPITKYLQKKLL